MEKIYLVMNKPAGFVCSAVSDSHQTVYSLLPKEMQGLLSAKRGERLHTVGRLDLETSGLLIFTTDGDFSNLLTRPENHVEKTYIATLHTPVTEQKKAEYKDCFLKGVILPAEKKAPQQNSGPATIDFLDDSRARVTISEGKFHQVRRMFLAVGNEVISLHRTQIGSFMLPGELSPGSYKKYTREDLLQKIYTGKEV